MTSKKHKVCPVLSLPCFPLSKLAFFSLRPLNSGALGQSPSHPPSNSSPAWHPLPVKPETEGPHKMFWTLSIQNVALLTGGKNKVILAPTLLSSDSHLLFLEGVLFCTFSLPVPQLCEWHSRHARKRKMATLPSWIFKNLFWFRGLQVYQFF